LKDSARADLEVSAPRVPGVKSPVAITVMSVCQ
jgi:hypothetical protein